MPAGGEPVNLGVRRHCEPVVNVLESAVLSVVPLRLLAEMHQRPLLFLECFRFIGSQPAFG